GMWLSTSPRAFALSIHALLIGVTTAPGPTAFTRIPRPAYSRASDLVRFSMPPLLTEYGRYFGLGMISCTLELFKMTPPPGRERKWRIASREQRKGPRRLTERTRSKSAASISWLAAGFWMPALLMWTLSCPKASFVYSIIHRRRALIPAIRWEYPRGATAFQSHANHSTFCPTIRSDPAARLRGARRRHQQKRRHRD